MEKREIVCINCPMGCRMTAETDAEGNIAVSGNTCKRGEIYARGELTRPVRMVTALVRVEGRSEPLPVKTSAAIDKRLIFDVLAALQRVTVQPSVSIGDVIIKNVLDTGADIVATADAPR